MSYSEAISYLYGLQKFGIKLGLTNIKILLSSLGNPHKKCPAIHIAGTNGKGSTAALLASVLTQAGYKTGLYTSPHLTSFTERIRINNRLISKKDVVRLTTLLKNKSAGLASITYFEVVTAMAFLYFEEQNVDIAILEVGMGGRLDATNVVSPILSIITTISKEHEFYLGSTLEKIAREKAGVIKRGRPVITGVTQPPLITLFKNRCKLLNCRFYRLGKDFNLTATESEKFNYHGMTFDLKEISLGLRGNFQVVNAALALATVDVLRSKAFHIDINAILKGLCKVSWPGRFEVVNNAPLVILDGAHNPAAMKSLKKTLLHDFDFKKLILVLGIMEDKNIKKMLREIVMAADLIFLTRPRMERAATTAVLADILEELNATNYHIIKDVRKATKFALSKAGRDDLLCITGSLFTIAEAQNLFKKKHFDNN